MEGELEIAGLDAKTIAILTRNDQRAHEKVCAQRWGLLIKIMLALLTAFIGCTGFMAKAMYENNKQQMAALESLVKDAKR